MKLKADHVSGMGDTLDLLVLGGYYGALLSRFEVNVITFHVPAKHQGLVTVDMNTFFLTRSKKDVGANPCN